MELNQDLVNKVNEVLTTATNADGVAAGMQKVASELKLDKEVTSELTKFAQETLTLSSLDTESLVKKALGKLGDSKQTVDWFLEGIDSFISENNLTANSDYVKAAVAMDVLANTDMDPETSALWYTLDLKSMG